MANYIVIACRSDHPPGYGYVTHPADGTKPGRPGSWGARAHGYSTLLIPCDNEAQIEAVKQRLNRGPVLLPFRDYGGEYWYGGRFDYVATVSSKDTVLAVTGYNKQKEGVCSLGDNRAVTIVTARDVLREDAQESMRKLQEFDRSTRISDNT